MKRYGLYPFMVFFFLVAFISGIYGFAANGWIYENSLPTPQKATPSASPTSSATP